MDHDIDRAFILEDEDEAIVDESNEVILSDTQHICNFLSRHYNVATESLSTKVYSEVSLIKQFQDELKWRREMSKSVNLSDIEPNAIPITIYRAIFSDTDINDISRFYEKFCARLHTQSYRVPSLACRECSFTFDSCKTLTDTLIDILTNFDPRLYIYITKKFNLQLNSLYFERSSLFSSHRLQKGPVASDEASDFLTTEEKIDLLRNQVDANAEIVLLDKKDLFRREFVGVADDDRILRLKQFYVPDQRIYCPKYYTNVQDENKFNSFDQLYIKPKLYDLFKTICIDPKSRIFCLQCLTTIIRRQVSQSLFIKRPSIEISSLYEPFKRNGIFDKYFKMGNEFKFPFQDYNCNINAKMLFNRIGIHTNYSFKQNNAMHKFKPMSLDYFFSQHTIHHGQNSTFFCSTCNRDLKLNIKTNRTIRLDFLDNIKLLKHLYFCVIKKIHVYGADGSITDVKFTKDSTWDQFETLANAKVLQQKVAAYENLDDYNFAVTCQTPKSVFCNVDSTLNEYPGTMMKKYSTFVYNSIASDPSNELYFRFHEKSKKNLYLLTANKSVDATNTKEYDIYDYDYNCKCCHVQFIPNPKDHTSRHFPHTAAKLSTILPVLNSILFSNDELKCLYDNNKISFFAKILTSTNTHINQLVYPYELFENVSFDVYYMYAMGLLAQSDSVNYKYYAMNASGVQCEITAELSVHHIFMYPTFSTNYGKDCLVELIENNDILILPFACKCFGNYATDITKLLYSLFSQDSIRIPEVFTLCQRYLNYDPILIANMRYIHQHFILITSTPISIVESTTHLIASPMCKYPTEIDRTIYSSMYDYIVGKKNRHYSNIIQTDKRRITAEINFVEAQFKRNKQDLIKQHRNEKYHVINRRIVALKNQKLARIKQIKCNHRRAIRNINNNINTRVSTFHSTPIQSASYIYEKHKHVTSRGT